MQGPATGGSHKAHQSPGSTSQSIRLEHQSELPLVKVSHHHQTWSWEEPRSVLQLARPTISTRGTPHPPCWIPAQHASQKRETLGRKEAHGRGLNCSENQKGILQMDGWTDSHSRNPTRHPTMRTLALDQQQQQQQPRTLLLAPIANSASPTC